MSSEELTIREVFEKLMEVQGQQTQIQKETADALTKMAFQLEAYNKIVQSRLWWIILACLVVVAGLVGIKLTMPGL